MIATNQPTRYEIALRHSDGRKFLVCYAARNSLRGLIAAVGVHQVAIARATGLDGSARFDLSTKPRPQAVCGDWWLGFTGRSQREVVNSGGRVTALPFISA